VHKQAQGVHKGCTSYAKASTTTDRGGAQAGKRGSKAGTRGSKADSRVKSTERKAPFNAGSGEPCLVPIEREKERKKSAGARRGVNLSVVPIPRPFAWPRRLGRSAWDHVVVLYRLHRHIRPQRLADDPSEHHRTAHAVDMLGGWDAICEIISDRRRDLQVGQTPTEWWSAYGCKESR